MKVLSVGYGKYMNRGIAEMFENQSIVKNRMLYPMENLWKGYGKPMLI